LPFVHITVLKLSAKRAKIEQDLALYFTEFQAFPVSFLGLHPWWSIAFNVDVKR